MYCSVFDDKQTFLSPGFALEFKVYLRFSFPPFVAFYRLCMCPGQSAIFVPLVLPLLICLVQAMSDDDFLVGVPAGDSSSDSSFVVGKVAPRRRVAGAPAPPAIGGVMDQMMQNLRTMAASSWEKQFLFVACANIIVR